MEIINVNDIEDTTVVVPVSIAGSTTISDLPVIFKGDKGDVGPKGDSSVADANWDSILNKPTSFPPSLHNHSIDQITDLQTALDNKQPLTNFKTVNSQSIIGTGDIVIYVGSIAWDDVTDKPVTFTPTTHSHSISEIAALQTTLDSKLDLTAVSTVARTVTDKTSIGAMRVALGLGTFATLSSVPNDHITNARLENMTANTLKGNNTGATSDPIDLTVSQVKTMLDMTVADISGLQTTLDNKQPLTTFKTINGEVITGSGNILVSGGATQISWDAVTDKPVTFTPTTHSHSINEIVDLQNTLDNKQPLTTFKTINGQEITGTGDIEIPAGRDGQSLQFVVITQPEYDALSLSEKEDATKAYMVI